MSLTVQVNLEIIKKAARKTKNAVVTSDTTWNTIAPSGGKGSRITPITKFQWENK